jgi:DNA-binding NtrC family response regulator
MQKARILVVDDEDDLRKLLTHFVSGAGYEVTAAEDGEQALEQLRKGAYDLALLDIMMPNMNGIELLKQIRQQSPGTKAIMLTGYTDLKNAMEAREFGARDFISKPFKMEDVLETIKRVLNE